ncbi:unnamed protein product [Hermetia illucens]|uniref:Uncharacterized protein n=1 Tax=Hermetia illucens TaxID=343691 RepID=A0A7R8YT53_HERIL|nr:uncharacterized protein LOC119652888 [Hermetia illucens]CAD7084607.1 unnamed protein product [Hermetia illucens]
MKSMLLSWLFVLFTLSFIAESSQSPHRFMENEPVLDALDQILPNGELQNLLSSTSKYPERTKISLKEAMDARSGDAIQYVLSKLQMCFQDLSQNRKRGIYMTPRLGREIEFSG